MRFALVCLSASALCLALLMLAWSAAPWLLTVDSGPVQTEAMVVLGGGVEDRRRRAAQLYNEFKPDLVVVTGNPKSDGIVQLLTLLTSLGVPGSRIQVAYAASTYENATSTAAILHKHHVTSAVIVTSWYHSRRALATFQKVAPDIHFSSRPSAPPEKALWWPNNYDRELVNVEFSKILYYAIVYSVLP